MIYFDKIEAYATGQMETTERTFFEQELVENDALKKEWEAYQLVHELIDYSANSSTEATIHQTAAESTTASILQFSAAHLSEAAILQTEQKAAPEAVIRPIKRRSYTAWLVAASVLFLVGMVGLRSFFALGDDPQVTEKIVATDSTPEVKPSESTIPTVLEQSIDKPKEAIIATTISDKKERTVPTPQKRTYEPAKVRTKPNVEVTATTAQKDEVAKVVSSPLAMTISAQEITAERVIHKNETIVYKAKNTITLKSGFHAKAGASFTATHDKPATPKSSTTVIEAD
ncbi:MAG: 3-coathanger stack domain-containing protein, partial [Bacteroidota bacterium]